jgi:HPt (histidine-containing phosphotransfer) domain-containing protein
MSGPVQQPVFLKDLHQPFFLKELPSIVGDEPPIDVRHLARASLGVRHLELQVLELFDRQAEMLLGCMRDLDRDGVASAAHTLAGSAREIGAWRVAEAADALERAVAENRDLASGRQTLDCAVVEARLAICAMLRISRPGVRALARRPSSGYRSAPG